MLQLNTTDIERLIRTPLEEMSFVSLNLKQRSTAMALQSLLFCSFIEKHF